MAINSTKVFEKMTSLYDFEAKLQLLDNKNILSPKQIAYTKDVNDSKALAAVKGPAIIISASGMLQGGRILHHLQQRLSKPENTVLFVGYQAEGTRGRALLEGKKEVKIHGQKISVNAKIENISGFSGHADYNEIIAWLMGFNRPPKKTFIVHGEPDASKALAEKIKSKFGWDTVIPEFEQTFELK
jgi:metallo-beta-lactamase family protein